MPHSHEAEGHDPEHASRAHVHLTGHGGSHDYDHDHASHDGAPPRHESEPGHGDDVVYLDNGMEVMPPKSDFGASDVCSMFFVAPACHPFLLVNFNPRWLGASRAPDEADSEFLTLLPHVLRI